jgi:hypothetical protein
MYKPLEDLFLLLVLDDGYAHKMYALKRIDVFMWSVP